MSKLIIRAITNKGGHVDLEQNQMDAILTFTLIFRCAEATENLPKVSWIPEPWRLELFPEFLKPDGAIVAFHMVTTEKPHEEILNMISFKTDHEGRHCAIINDENIIRASRAFEDFPEKFTLVDSQPDFIPDEMNGGWKNVEVLKNRVPEDDEIKLLAGEARSHCMVNVVTDGDNNDFSFSVKADTLEHEPEVTPSIDLAPKPIAESVRKHELSHKIIKGYPNGFDMFSDKPLDTISYRIYVNGIPSDVVVDNIDFMKHINDYITNHVALGPDALSEAIPGSLEMASDMYGLLVTFLTKRNFAIGAHPVNEPLEDGNDAWYKLYWSKNHLQTIYMVPLGISSYGDTMLSPDENIL